MFYIDQFNIRVRCLIDLNVSQLNLSRRRGLSG